MSTASEIDTAGFLIESVVSKTKQLQKETSSSGISSPTYISKSNEDQCQTYRIPSLVTAPDGTLICAVEARWKYKGDYGDGKISLAVKRSQDGGETWA
jgi:sialidase-1